MTIDTRRHNLTQNLVLPTLLFAALGGMTWAVRGSSGYGGSAGCIFAGVMWGAAWWFLAYDPTGKQTRRYASAWIVPAVTIGVGLSGNRGWMQWSSFFEGRLQTNYGAGEFVPISRTYGFIWLFIAGVPWAGIGACTLAWCGSLRQTRVWHWIIRIACGLGAAFLARYLYETFPQYFLPLYSSMEDRYQDFEANPNLRRLINDCRLAIFHLGLYLGFLLYELGRRDWKNAVLIATVGLLNGIGWAACQNWKWAPDVWQGASFNWWRCWESSGGISIGVAYGVAYFLVNREMSDKERAAVAARRSIAGPNFEWLLVYSGLAWLAALFVREGMGGWGNLYFTVVLLFGVGYYFLNRGPTPDVTSQSPEQSSNGISIDWPAVGVSAALIAGLYLPRRSVGFGLMLCYLAAVMLLGLAWYMFRRSDYEAEQARATPATGDANLERLGLYLGLLMGLGLSIRNGLKGWFNIYKGNEDEWSRVLWQILGPTFLMILIAIAAWVLLRPGSRETRSNLFPHAYALMWLVLIVQNTLAQLITGPLWQWNEMAFNIYYVLLFAITAVIVFHFQTLKEEMTRRTSSR